MVAKMCVLAYSTISPSHARTHANARARARAHTHSCTKALPTADCDNVVLAPPLIRYVHVSTPRLEQVHLCFI